MALLIRLATHCTEVQQVPHVAQFLTQTRWDPGPPKYEGLRCPGWDVLSGVDDLLLGPRPCDPVEHVCNVLGAALPILRHTVLRLGREPRSVSHFEEWVDHATALPHHARIDRFRVPTPAKVGLEALFQRGPEVKANKAILGGASPKDGKA
eukprot:scaffold232220_cov36-Tisochrysis_lutea.AAC.4